ncbi:MAG: peptidase M50 [Clostridia bacterium]|nr:peptidase M50 [Clostridia bacterium]
MMLEKTLCGVRFRVSLLFPALLSALLLARADSPAVSCVIASAMHEAGHLLAMLMLGCPPHACTLGAFGMRIEMGARRMVGYRRNILISLAGPTVNLLAAPLLWALGCRQAAVVHAVLAAFNLLPASALDGGQVMYCLLCMTGRERTAPCLIRVLSAVVLLPLAVVAFWLVLSGRGNGTLLIVSGYAIALIFWHPEN